MAAINVYAKAPTPCVTSSAYTAVATAAEYADDTLV